jgi:hypothetical protein
MENEMDLGSILLADEYSLSSYSSCVKLKLKMTVFWDVAPCCLVEID